MPTKSTTPEIVNSGDFQSELTRKKKQAADSERARLLDELDAQQQHDHAEEQRLRQELTAARDALEAHEYARLVREHARAQTAVLEFGYRQGRRAGEISASLAKLVPADLARVRAAVQREWDEDNHTYQHSFKGTTQPAGTWALRERRLSELNAGLAELSRLELVEDYQADLDRLVTSLHLKYLPQEVVAS